METQTSERFSDEWLDLEASQPRPSAYGNAAELLKQVPFEDRQGVCSEAHTMGNYLGGQPSSNIRQCAANYLDGNRGFWRERAARDREFEQSKRHAEQESRRISSVNYAKAMAERKAKSGVQ